MVFFDFSIGETGREVFRVSGRLWLFLAVTVPLTLLVFAVWIIWQRWRARRKEIAVSLEFGENVEMSKVRDRRYSDAQKWYADTIAYSKATLRNQRPPGLANPKISATHQK